MNERRSSESMTARSVDNLKTLYTVIIALALVEAVKAILNIGKDGSSISLQTERFPVFVAFLATIIPFHHGASRHLDETYIARKEEIIPLTGLMDFLLFFTHAIVFYVLALSISNISFFILMLIVLFGIDVVWLALVYLSSADSFKKMKAWFWLNLGFVVALIVLHSDVIPQVQHRCWILAILCLIRTLLDYLVSWSFYWPIADKEKRGSGLHS